MRIASWLGIAVVLTIGSARTQSGQQAPPTFRSSVATVSIYATARASDGRLVPELEKSDFEIRDNGIVREVTVFSREIVPITVTLMLDMSGSRENKIEWMRAAARAFVDAMIPEDRGRIGTFGSEISISPRLTSDKSYLHRVIDEEIWPGGPTPLWESIDDAMSSLQDQAGRRVILVVTDGYDTTGGRIPTASLSTARGLGSVPTINVGPSLGNRRRISSNDVLTRAQREQFMLYAVSIGPANNATTSPLNLPMMLLATETGGGYHTFGSTADAVQAMRQVADELHHQYLLGFQPERMDGKTHKLDVRIKHSGMSAEARKSYVAIDR